MNNQNISKLTLNLVPVIYPNETSLEVGIQTYQNEEHLRLIRDCNKETHLFKRQGDKIISIPLLQEHKLIGTKKEEIHLEQHPEIVALLVLSAIRKYSQQKNCRILEYRPLKVIRQNILQQCLPQGTTLPPYLEVCIYYVFDTRIIYTNSKPQVFLTCDVRTKNLINPSCDKLIKDGINIQGKYVQKKLDNQHLNIEAKRFLVGKVDQIKDDTLYLVDHKDGFSNILQSEAYLEPRKENMELCISSLLGQKAPYVIDELKQNIVKLQKGDEKLSKTRGIFKALNSGKIELIEGISLSFGELLSQENSQTNFPKHEFIAKPQLIFNPSRSRTDLWNEPGLDNHGAYDQRTFTPTQPNIAIICQATKKGQFEQFIHKFLEGLPQVIIGKENGKRAPYGKGFIRRFGLSQPTTKFFDIPNSHVDSYISACKEAIRYASGRNIKWDLAIVQIEDKFHSLYGKENPYFATKSSLLKQQIPVQEIEIESASLPDDQLVYILNNISLAVYAKMGGTPWLLKANPPVAHELVFGLGSCNIGSSRLGGRERVVGITTVFTGDGNYLLSNRSTAVSYNDYQQALLECIRETIELVREEQNWGARDSVRLIFHSFKPLKNAEIEAVKQSMMTLGTYDVEYAFIHFVDDHPLHVFDENNNQSKGKFAPQRGLLVNLSRYESILSFTGAREIKRLDDGMPQPILLRLHRSSTFTDLTYLARRAFDFSCHSWRTFSPLPLPVTILYSELIARLLKGLSEIPDWDADAMLGRIGRTRWFL